MKRNMRTKNIALALGAIGAALAGTALAKTTVTLWSWSPVESTMKAMVAAIEKQHPNINIRITIEPHTAYFTALKAAAASGTMPDIVGLSPGAVTQAYRPHLLNLGPVAAKLWGPSWRSDFPPALLSEVQFGNPAANHGYYMLPEEAEVINLWYNRSIFKKAGIASPPKTLNQLIADAAKIRAAGFIPFYQGGGTGLFDEWVYMQLAAQTDLSGLLKAQKGAAVWTQPGMVKAAVVWKKLFTSGLFQPGALSSLQYPTGANLFAAGRVGMMSLGSWWMQESFFSGVPAALKGMAGYGKLFFPAVLPGGHPTPPIGGVDVGWGVTKNAARSAATLKATEVVLKELISGAGEQVALNQLNDLPAFAGMKPTVALPAHLASLYRTYIAELKHAYPHAIGNTTIYEALVNELQAIAAGTVTPSAGMAVVQSTALAQK